MVTPAIATRALDVQFRSRLEAKWAHMFEAAGWHWAYEPVDLAGYIPDSGNRVQWRRP